MNWHTLLNIAATAVGLAALAGSAVGQETGEHKLISPQDIKWGPAPPSLPPSAQAAVLYGDPGKEGMFAFRLKVPKGYHIAPHTHPKPEIVTVVSGTARLGWERQPITIRLRFFPRVVSLRCPPVRALFLRRRRDGYTAEQHRSVGHQLHQSKGRSASEDAVADADGKSRPLFRGDLAARPRYSPAPMS